MTEEPPMKSCPSIEVYLTVNDGEAAIDFYRRAFGAEETFRMMAEDGKRIMHANLTMFGAELMLSDAFPEFSTQVCGPSPEQPGHITVHINLDKAEALDQAVERARKEGALVTMEPDNMFWGARYASLRDPEGHNWSFAGPLAESA